MFEHSVKVPRIFKISANIVKKVATEGGGVKNLLYDSKLRFFRTNVIYAIITETIKHAADIDKLFEATGILEKEQRLDPWLARVITTELLFGKKELPGLSKPEQTIISYKEQFEKIPLEQAEVKSEVRRPRYVRINTNLLTTSDAIRAFQDEGYRFIRCTSGTYNDYLHQLQGLSEYDFTQDYHVKTMFVFHPSTKFHDHDLYYENKIVLQDKATTLPVQLLAPPPGSVVLDMCAAPGMKTTQVAAFMRNQGKVYAVERNADRYQTLCDFVAKTESKCVTTMHRDSLAIKKGECEDVEYIILDPSCSGSGMQLSVHNYVDDVRLARLTSLQEKFLKHAMNSFPNARKIVYSTCSLFPEENERVISNVVRLSRAKWKVLNAKELLKDQWNNFGSGMYGEMGTRCLYAKPDSDFTTGFFLAVLERDPKQIENTENADVESVRAMKSKSKSREKDTVSENITYESVDDNNEKDDRKKKKKSKESNDTVKTEELEKDAVHLQGSYEHSKKSKKKKNKDMEVDHCSDNGLARDLQTSAAVDDEPKRRKKRKQTETESENINSLEESNINEINDNADIQIEEQAVSKKEKKKRKNKEVLDNTSEDNAEELKKKSKKKNSEYSSPNDLSPNDECEPVKKKKKKRSKESC